MTLETNCPEPSGMMVAVMVVASSMVAGVINAFILDLPLKTAGDGIRFWLVFALRNSADRIIRPGDRQRHISFNDLARELIAIMLIPELVRRSRSTALGLRRNVDGLYPAGTTTLRRAGDGSHGYRARFYFKFAGSGHDGLLLPDTFWR